MIESKKRDFQVARSFVAQVTNTMLDQGMSPGAISAALWCVSAGIIGAASRGDEAKIDTLCDDACEIMKKEAREAWDIAVDHVRGGAAPKEDKVFWLSFVKDGAFAGVIITSAKDFISAVKKTFTLGINPGGEVAGDAIPEEFIHAVRPSSMDRLLQRAETDAIKSVMKAGRH